MTQRPGDKVKNTLHINGQKILNANSIPVSIRGRDLIHFQREYPNEQYLECGKHGPDTYSRSGIDDERNYAMCRVCFDSVLSKP